MDCLCDDSVLHITIVGRPNVGKSTLFNRLLHKKTALVSDTPGLTRDLRMLPTYIGDHNIVLVDTPGLDMYKEDVLQGHMTQATLRAIQMADICIFVLDGCSEITAHDFAIADILRKSSMRVILVSNKLEKEKARINAYSASELGLGVPIAISAAHGVGIHEMCSFLQQSISDVLLLGSSKDKEISYVQQTYVGDEEGKNYIKIAIIGKPNIGKSTLANAIIGDNAMIVSDESGVTRDTIAFQFLWRGTPVRIFDTAGIRRRYDNNKKHGLEKLFVDDAMKALQFADVIVVLSEYRDDAVPDAQDIRLVGKAADEGRAVIFGISKCDTCDNIDKARVMYQEKMSKLVCQIRDVPVVMLSAKTGYGIDRLRKSIIKSHDKWNQRISTGVLNRWLSDIVLKFPHPIVGGKPVRIKYITQVNTRPPTFAIFCSRVMHMSESYRRFLTNSLGNDFGFRGVPIRVMTRK